MPALRALTFSEAPKCLEEAWKPTSRLPGTIGARAWKEGNPAEVGSRLEGAWKEVGKVPSRPATCSRRSTAGSAKASTRRTLRRRRRCSTTWREGKNRPNASRNDVALLPSGFRDDHNPSALGAKRRRPLGKIFSNLRPLKLERKFPPPFELQPPPQRCGLNSDGERDGNSKRFTPSPTPSQPQTRRRSQ